VRLLPLTTQNFPRGAVPTVPYDPVPVTETTWRNVWNRPAVILPFIAVGIAFLGVSLTIRSNNNAEKSREQSAFALAAAQVVMNQPTCKLGQARARTLIGLFSQLKGTLEPLTKPNLSPALCKELRRRTTPQQTNASTLPLGPSINNPFTALDRRAVCLLTFGRIYKPDQQIIAAPNPYGQNLKPVTRFNPCYGLKP
jgi:hypothetical protein